MRAPSRPFLLAIIPALASILVSHHTARAQSYQIEGWEIKKGWGPLRTVYVLPGKLPRFVFEDALGTVRIIEVNESNGTAVPVVEMKRK